MKNKNVITSLLPLLKLYPWAIPTIIILGIISSFSEGLGISLFIPLLQSVSEPSSQLSNQLSHSNFLVDTLNKFFANYSSQTR